MSTQNEQIQSSTENPESKTDELIPFILPARDWKTFEQQAPPADTVIWLKLSNENVVLAIYRNNGSGSTGWWQISYKDGVLLASTSTAFIAKGAFWQQCVQF